MVKRIPQNNSLRRRSLLISFSSGDEIPVEKGGAWATGSQHIGKCVSHLVVNSTGVLDYEPLGVVKFCYRGVIRHRLTYCGSAITDTDVARTIKVGITYIKAW